MPQNDRGQWMCWRRRRRCQNANCRHDPENLYLEGLICEHCGKPLNEPNPKCRHKFTKEEHDLWECPECGMDRHCRNPVPEEGKACKFHGGNLPKGFAHPNFTTGLTSKYMPSNLLQDYEDFLNHPNKLQVEESLALVRAIIWERVRDLDQLGSPTAWTSANKVFTRLKRAKNSENEENFERYFDQLGEILEKGENQASKRDEIRKFIEQERKLVDTQRQICVDMGEFMTRAMVIGTINYILNATKEQMDDLDDGQQRLTKIANAVERIFGSVHRSKPALRGRKDGIGSGHPTSGRDGVGSEIRWDKIPPSPGSEEVPF